MANPNVMSQVATVVAGDMEKAIDAEIDRLDNLNEDDFQELRRRRIEEMRKDANNKEKWKREGHGKLIELSEEKEFFDLVKRSQRVVALFCRAGNKFADDLKDHLAVIAQHHMETRFVLLDAEKRLVFYLYYVYYLYYLFVYFFVYFFCVSFCVFFIVSFI